MGKPSKGYTKILGHRLRAGKTQRDLLRRINRPLSDAAMKVRRTISDPDFSRELSARCAALVPAREHTGEILDAMLKLLGEREVSVQGIEVLARYDEKKETIAFRVLDK